MYRLHSIDILRWMIGDNPSTRASGRNPECSRKAKPEANKDYREFEVTRSF